MKFLEFDTAWEPEIIGVNNGICQLKFDESFLKTKKEKENFFLNFPKDVNIRVDAPMNFSLLNKGKITDVMSYGQVIIHAPYIVSQRFVDIFRQYHVLEYDFISVKFLNVEIDAKYFLFRYPYTDLSQIDIRKIVVYLGSRISGKKYFEFSTFSEYWNFNLKNRLCRIEYIETNTSELIKDFIKFTKPGDMISEQFANALVDNGITGLKIGGKESCVMEVFDS